MVNLVTELVRMLWKMSWSYIFRQFLIFLHLKIKTEYKIKRDLEGENLYVR